MEEKGYNGFDGLEVKKRLNPNLNDDFSQFSLKTDHYMISYRMY